MSAIDQTFNESVLRLQGWLHFLERKAAEYQAQMNRVRRGSGGTPAAEPVSTVSDPAPVSGSGPATEVVDGWE